MKNIILAILVLVPLVAYSNDNSGVKETNYSVGLSYGVSRVDGLSNNYNNTTLSSSIIFPIYKHIASSISINGYKTGKIKYDYDDSYTSKSSGYSTLGSVFLRDKDIGKIGVSAGYAESKTKITSSSPSITLLNNSFYLKSYSYSIYGSYYFNDFTFSASRSVDDLDNGHDVNTWTIGASYYFKENTMIRVSKIDVDSDNNFGIGVIHQPYFFDNSTEAGISYANNKYSSSVLFFINYHFGTRVSLKTRDREYR